MKTDIVIRRATFAELAAVHALLTAQRLPLDGMPETIDDSSSRPMATRAAALQGWHW